MRLVALFAALAVLSAYIAAFSFGAGVDESSRAPWWALPGLVGGAALAVIFAAATVIRLIIVIIESLRRR
ncbi:MAG: hypothetical protein ACR2LK_00315 [Solirubrobacteraceae bacterium]